MTDKERADEIRSLVERLNTVVAEAQNSDMVVGLIDRANDPTMLPLRVVRLERTTKY